MSGLLTVGIGFTVPSFLKNNLINASLNLNIILITFFTPSSKRVWIAGRSALSPTKTRAIPRPDKSFVDSNIDPTAAGKSVNEQFKIHILVSYY